MAENLPDTIQVMLTIQSGERHKKPIERSILDSYLFILNSRGIEFSYGFQFDPLPHSSDLEEDLRDMLIAHYVSFKSPIRLTSDGQKYLDRKRRSRCIPKDLECAIDGVVAELVDYTERDLYDAIYRQVTQ